jgi:hypothetical protein
MLVRDLPNQGRGTVDKPVLAVARRLLQRQARACQRRPYTTGLRSCENVSRTQIGRAFQFSAVFAPTALTKEWLIPNFWRTVLVPKCSKSSNGLQVRREKEAKQRMKIIP